MWRHGRKLATPPKLLILKCRRGDLNPHGSYPPPDFESGASANSATPARLKTNYLRNPNTFFFSVDGGICGDFASKTPESNEGNLPTACRL